MAATSMLSLSQPGAPGIYRLPPEPARPVLGVPMDVCAFVGVAPRGPARVPIPPETWNGERALVEPQRPRQRSVAVPIESFDEYRRLYGGFEGPGRLPYALASFFEQGGRKAYVVRIVADYDDPAEALQGSASGKLPKLISSAGPVTLVARNEGGWGNRLRAAMGYTTNPVLVRDWLGPTTLSFDPDEALSPGTLLRLVFDEPGPHAPLLRQVSLARREGDPDGSRQQLRVTLSAPLPDRPVVVEVVEGELLIEDGAGSRERFAGLGLAPAHPRWLATVLYNESDLVYPDPGWVERSLEPLPGTTLPLPPQIDGPDSATFHDGIDRYAAIAHSDFFDPNWTPAESEPGEGIACLAGLDDLSTLVVPDLYVPEALARIQPDQAIASLAGAEFAPCVQPPVEQQHATQAPLELPGLRLDPRVPDELKAIIALQQALAGFVDRHRGMVALLDVPLGLSQAQTLQWRAGFNSSYVAAYHPWLQVSRADDQRNDPVRLNPSAAAAGIIAARELSFGLPHGPANQVVVGAFDVSDRVSPQRHAQLHPLGINVYLRERDGIRLSAARTLSRDRHYRQLSVRRLMLMLRRALEQQMQWAVFEPNGPHLWSEVRLMLRNYLRGLYRAGAFRGGSEEEAFFVRCDAAINDRPGIDAGRMLAEVGVAPAEPLEFIVVRITRSGDGTLTLET